MILVVTHSNSNFRITFYLALSSPSAICVQGLQPVSAAAPRYIDIFKEIQTSPGVYSPIAE